MPVASGRKIMLKRFEEEYNLFSYLRRCTAAEPSYLNFKGSPGWKGPLLDGISHA
jgi:hypothetical protein